VLLVILNRLAVFAMIAEVINFFDLLILYALGVVFVYAL